MVKKQYRIHVNESIPDIKWVDTTYSYLCIILEVHGVSQFYDDTVFVVVF